MGETPRKPISIKDVAASAGVSPATVSHVISGNRPVRAATAERVQQAMSRLGYVPSRAAQTLRSGLNRTIGLLVPDIRNSFFADLARGVEDRALLMGYNVVLGNTDFDRERERRYLDLVRSRSIDGLVYAAGAPPAHRFLRSVEQEIPIVLADEEVPSFRSALVLSNHHEGGRIVGTHLSAHGHTRVLAVTGPAGLLSSTRRLTGFRDGFDGSDIEVHVGDFHEQSGYAAVLRYATGGRFPFSAVFALNDLMAAGAIQALSSLGLHVPDDVSVVGYDDIPLARQLTPALTTVAQPAYEIGQASASQLLQGVIEGRPIHPSTHVLDVSLIIRDSEAPVRQTVVAA